MVDESGSTNDDEFDFGDEELPLTSAAKVDDGMPSAFSGDIVVGSQWAVWARRLDANAFAKARQSVDLRVQARRTSLRALLAGRAEYDAAYLYERGDYDAPTLDAYEWLVDLREAYVAYSTGAFDFTLGRQIVPWGETDLFSPIDVVNPRDNREPGLADVVDLRLPVLASRVGYFAGAHRVEAMVVHEAWFGYRAPPLGTFSPLAARVDVPVSKPVEYRHLQPRFATAQQQLFLRWVYRGHGLDAGLYLASVLDPDGAFVLPDVAELDDPAVAVVGLGLDHRRYTLVGHSGARPLGRWVVKWDLGVEVGRSVNVDRSDAGGPSFPMARTTVGTAAVSGTYTGVDNLVLVVEGRKGVYLDEPDGVVYPYDIGAGALRATYRLLRDDLEIELVGFGLGERLQHGWMARLQASYALRDAMWVTLGYATYAPGDDFGPIAGFDRHDRLFLRLRWARAL